MTIKKEHFVPMELADWQTAVIDKDLTTSPESPSDGDRYIIAGTGGDWSVGTIKDIAWYIGSTWFFISPVEGMQVYINDENLYYFYNGSTWATVGGSGDMNTSVYDKNDVGIVDKAQSIDDDNGNVITASEIINMLYNIVLLAFYRAIDNSKVIYNLVNGFIDEYEDESGINTVSSENQLYNSSDDYYSPVNGYGVDTKLMLHCNGTNGSTSFPDDSNSSHTITANGDVQVSTAQKKFGTGSAYFDGTGDYLSAPDSSDWDIVSSNSDSWTLELWVKHTDHSGYENYIAQREAGSTWWILRHVDGLGLNFKVISSGSTVIDTGYGGEITDTNWHHIALIKVANEYAIYLDGTQVVYTQDNDILNMSAILTIGASYYSGSGYEYFDGYIDEIRIEKSNVFNASPNSGKTDIISVPSSEYTSAILNMSLISESQTAESEPSSARIVCFEEDVDAITLNTDLKAYISRDDGLTWAEATLSDEGDYASSKRVIVGTADLSISGVGSGTDMVYKLVTANAKDLKVHGTALLWD